MRLSCRQSDPDYSPIFVGTGVRVLLDGVELSSVLTVDDAGGWVVRLARNAQGRFYLTRDGGTAAEEFLSGRVQIVVPAGHVSERLGWLKATHRARRSTA